MCFEYSLFPWCLSTLHFSWETRYFWILPSSMLLLIFCKLYPFLSMRFCKGSIFKPLAFCKARGLQGKSRKARQPSPWACHPHKVVYCHCSMHVTVKNVENFTVRNDQVFRIYVNQRAHNVIWGSISHPSNVTDASEGKHSLTSSQIPVKWPNGPYCIFIALAMVTA